MKFELIILAITFIAIVNCNQPNERTKRQFGHHQQGFNQFSDFNHGGFNRFQHGGFNRFHQQRQFSGSINNNNINSNGRHFSGSINNNNVGSGFSINNNNVGKRSIRQKRESMAIMPQSIVGVPQFDNSKENIQIQQNFMNNKFKSTSQNHNHNNKFTHQTSFTQHRRPSTFTQTGFRRPSTFGSTGFTHHHHRPSTFTQTGFTQHTRPSTFGSTGFTHHHHRPSTFTQTGFTQHRRPSTFISSSSSSSFIQRPQTTFTHQTNGFIPSTGFTSQTTFVGKRSIRERRQFGHQQRFIHDGFSRFNHGMNGGAFNQGFNHGFNGGFPQQRTFSGSINNNNINNGFGASSSFSINNNNING